MRMLDVVSLLFSSFIVELLTKTYPQWLTYGDLRDEVGAEEDDFSLFENSRCWAIWIRLITCAILFAYYLTWKSFKIWEGTARDYYKRCTIDRFNMLITNSKLETIHSCYLFRKGSTFIGQSQSRSLLLFIYVSKPVRASLIALARVSKFRKDSFLGRRLNKEVNK